MCYQHDHLEFTIGCSVWLHAPYTMQSRLCETTCKCNYIYMYVWVCISHLPRLAHVLCFHCKAYSAMCTCKMLQLIAVTCHGQPAPTANATFSQCPGQVVGAVCTGSCLPGFLGTPSTTCLANATWSQVTGNCTESAYACWLSTLL